MNTNASHFHIDVLTWLLIIAILDFVTGRRFSQYQEWQKQKNLKRRQNLVCKKGHFKQSGFFFVYIKIMYFYQDYVFLPSLCISTKFTQEEDSF